MVAAAERKDTVLLTDGVMVTGAIALLALLLTDVCMILLDPRIRFGNAEGLWTSFPSGLPPPGG